MRGPYGVARTAVGDHSQSQTQGPGEVGSAFDGFGVPLAVMSNREDNVVRHSQPPMGRPRDPCTNSLGCLGC